jgi:TRAP-type mannitol/chloroaromatic compound transport system permease small subunit
MGWVKTQKVIHRLSFYVAVFGMSFIIPLMLLTRGDIIGRKFFSKTIPGTFEISEFILAIFILLGAAYTQQVKGHVEACGLPLYDPCCHHGYLFIE